MCSEPSAKARKRQRLKKNKFAATAAKKEHYKKVILPNKLKQAKRRAARQEECEAKARAVRSAGRETLDAGVAQPAAPAEGSAAWAEAARHGEAVAAQRAAARSGKARRPPYQSVKQTVPREMGPVKSSVSSLLDLVPS